MGLPGAGKGGSSSPYDEVDDLFECGLWKNRAEAISEDIGEEDRVVVLGR